jgi:hypothetical protein
MKMESKKSFGKQTSIKPADMRRSSIASKSIIADALNKKRVGET